jgi:uncharacterized membrane protein YfcA
MLVVRRIHLYPWAGQLMNYDLSSMVFLVVLSFLPAVVDSCLGMGYGFTVTPLLLVLGFSPIQAVPAVLFSSLVGNLLSAYFHHQFKNVDFSADSIHLRISLIMGGLGSIGSLVGALVAIGISTFYLNLYIGLMVTTLGFFVLFSRRLKLRFSWPRMVAFGAVGAFNKGISGSGFGPIVTTGELLVGLDEKAMVSIQSFSELFASIVGFLTFVLSRASVDVYLTLAMSIGVAFSSPIAAFIVHKMPAEKLRWLIAVTAIVLGVITLVRPFLV